MIDSGRAALVAVLMATCAVTPSIAQQTGVAPTPPPAPGAVTQQGQVSDVMVRKVGMALRQTATIRQKYAERMHSQTAPEQQQLTQQAQSEMMKAISDQGLSVQQYNQVIQMAQADPSLKQRLISVAQSGG
jgi:Domain of unknown function (DUF4168)